MLFTFLQKQTDRKKQKKLIETMIASLSISPEQKSLYFQAIEVMNEQEAQILFSNLTKFIEKIELKEIEEIKKENYISVAGMRKKEAEEKLEEMNSFSFLLHNL